MLLAEIAVHPSSYPMKLHDRVVRAGLPFRCLTYVMREDSSVKGGLVVGHLNIPWKRWDRAIPLAPLWSGLVIDVVFLVPWVDV